MLAHPCLKYQYQFLFTKSRKADVFITVNSVELICCTFSFHINMLTDHSVPNQIQEIHITNSFLRVKQVLFSLSYDLQFSPPVLNNYNVVRTINGCMRVLYNSLQIARHQVRCTHSVIHMIKILERNNNSSLGRDTRGRIRNIYYCTEYMSAIPDAPNPWDQKWICQIEMTQGIYNYIQVHTMYTAHWI